MWNVQCIIWKGRFHYDSPACFSCSIVSFEGRGFFSCVSVFFNLDLSNFSISAMSGLSDMLAGESARTREEPVTPGRGSRTRLDPPRPSPRSPPTPAGPRPEGGRRHPPGGRRRWSRKLHARRNSGA